MKTGHIRVGEHLAVEHPEDITQSRNWAPDDWKKMLEEWNRTGRKPEAWQEITSRWDNRP